MKKYIKQVKKGLAALLAVVMVVAVAPVMPAMAELEGYQLHRVLVEWDTEDFFTLVLDATPTLNEEAAWGRITTRHLLKLRFYQ